jgi:hypothetical protein
VKTKTSWNGHDAMAGPARELSTKWWNVIRRKMRATATKEYAVECPDCGSSPMHLLDGKYGRFYKCPRLDCRGTLGAKLDGTPRVQRGPPELLDARRRAREAVHRVVVERDRALAEEVESRKARGLDWWNCAHKLASCKDEFRIIVFGARLDPVSTTSRRRNRKIRVSPPVSSFWHACGLFIRRRNVEECERIIEAATIVLRRVRKNAWDKVFDDAIASDDSLPLQDAEEVEHVPFEIGYSVT